MAGLSIANVGKRYGVVEVLRGVSMDVANGEFVVLVGPSGCGKSTLLRMIAGLEDITAGEIAIGGRVVNDVPPTHRDIAMVFQNYALYPHKTVAGNMSFSLQRKRMPKAEIRAKVEAAARVLGLEPLLDRYPRELSGGQRQRVAMGRAIVRDPQVFLFDEPLSNLDAKLRVQMRAEVKELHQRLTTTTVYVTHDQVEAMTMADRIVVMRDGRIEQIGSPLELYDRPANAFVASFIGSPSMNLLPGRMTPAGFRTSDGTILPCESRDAAATLYGIRPEHLRLDPDGVALTVKVLEPTGAETQVIGRLGDEPVSGVFRERLDAVPGSTLRVSPEPGQVHLFDASEARIGSWPTDP